MARNFSSFPNHDDLCRRRTAFALRRLTHRQATACLAQLLQSVGGAAPGSALVVDAAPLRVFDTSALAVLLEFRREALAARLRFAVQGLPQALQGMPRAVWGGWPAQRRAA